MVWRRTLLFPSASLLSAPNRSVKIRSLRRGVLLLLTRMDTWEDHDKSRSGTRTAKIGRGRTFPYHCRCGRGPNVSQNRRRGRVEDAACGWCRCTTVYEGRRQSRWRKVTDTPRHSMTNAARLAKRDLHGRRTQEGSWPVAGQDTRANLSRLAVQFLFCSEAAGTRPFSPSTCCLPHELCLVAVRYRLPGGGGPCSQRSATPP